MKRATRLLAAVLFLLPGIAEACPFCDSDTGAEVRAGIFNAEFFNELLLVLLPFPILLAIIVLLYTGLPSRHPPGKRGIV